MSKILISKNANTICGQIRSHSQNIPNVHVTTKKKWKKRKEKLNQNCKGKSFNSRQRRCEFLSIFVDTPNERRSLWQVLPSVRLVGWRLNETTQHETVSAVIFVKFDVLIFSGKVTTIIVLLQDFRSNSNSATWATCFLKLRY